MSFFAKIASGVEKAAQTGKLDAIVDRRVQQYEREVEQITLALRKLYSQEQVVQMEQEIIDRCLLAYDGEAVPYIGKQVNANWNEGGGDLLEVRKRMLNRELQNRRGRLAAAMAGLRANTQVQLDSLTVFVRQTEQQIKTTLPTDVPTIENQLLELRQNLTNLVTPNFPGGLPQFDALVDGAVETQLTTLKQHILAENERLREKMIRDFREKSFTALYDALYWQITTTTSEVKSDLTNDNMIGRHNNVITLEVVEGVRREMDQAMSRYLNDLRNIKLVD